MPSEDIISIIREAIEQSVKPAGIVRMPILSESGDQVARDIADALENAGFEIMKRNDRN
jgi:hypothetical protein